MHMGRGREFDVFDERFERSRQTRDVSFAVREKMRWRADPEAGGRLLRAARTCRNADARAARTCRDGAVCHSVRRAFFGVS
jgi:hypothetical protein